MVEVDEVAGTNSAGVVADRDPDKVALGHRACVAGAEVDAVKGGRCRVAPVDLGAAGVLVDAIGNTCSGSTFESTVVVRCGAGLGAGPCVDVSDVAGFGHAKQTPNTIVCGVESLTAAAVKHHGEAETESEVGRHGSLAEGGGFDDGAELGQRSARVLADDRGELPDDEFFHVGIVHGGSQVGHGDVYILRATGCGDGGEQVIPAGTEPSNGDGGHILYSTLESNH